MDNQPNPVNPNANPERSTAPSVEGLKPPVAEQAPRSGAAVGAAGQPAAQSTLSPADVAAAIAAVPTPGTPVASTPAVPAIADDVDVIEPEWVDKAEQVVTSHQGDPYGEEEAIEDLQRDYLQKRYGHAVGDPDKTKSEGS